MLANGRASRVRHAGQSYVVRTGEAGTFTADERCPSHIRRHINHLSAVRVDTIFLLLLVLGGWAVAAIAATLAMGRFIAAGKGELSSPVGRDQATHLQPRPDRKQKWHAA
jgi:hypothetical protein